MSGDEGIGRGARLLDWLSERLNLTEIFSLLTSYGLFYAELDNRKPLREALAESRATALPSYARWPRVLGLVVVVLLVLEGLTGALLALYYLPTTDSARASVGTILRQVDFGWFVHQMHFWGAQLLIAVLALRLFRFFAQRLYRPPRELVWVFATLLLLVCLHLDLSGRALPMTDPAYWSTIRALEILQSVPIYGSAMLFLLGDAGPFIGDLTLIRLYALHVAILPAAALILIYLHFSTVRRVGLTERPGEERLSAPAALPRHLVNLAILLVLLVGVLVSLAVLAPIGFEAAADPFATPQGVGPPWYLLAVFGFLEATAGAVPRAVAGFAVFFVFVLLVLLPFLDRSGGRRAGALRAVLAVLALAAWLAFTILGMRAA